jgi:glycerate 2-kinase
VIRLRRLVETSNRVPPGVWIGRVMGVIVQNRDRLTGHGLAEGRGLALDIIDRSLASVDAALLTKARMHLAGDVLEIDDWRLDLSDVRDVYVLGAGKGVLQIAEALDGLLGERIRSGLVIEKRLVAMPEARRRIRRMRYITVLEAGHPIPDQAGVEGVGRLLDIADRAGEGDLVFVCVQGGCSSLTTLPAPGLTLSDVRHATESLLRGGVDIGMLDIVRMAMTQLQGGALAMRIHPATIINLVVNDFVWSYPDRWRDAERAIGWGPSVPVRERERQRLGRIVEELKSVGAWGYLPERVRGHLLHGDPGGSAFTAHDFDELGIRWRTVILADLRSAAEAAERVAREMGLGAMILSTAMEGEAAQVGTVFAGIAKEIAMHGRPISPPCALLCAGEMTVTIGSEHGTGGRNLECALSAACGIEGSERIIIACVGTDGTDGPTPFAGGIVDGGTARRARELGIDIRRARMRHDAASALAGLDDAILFNQPGNNLCDLCLILVA